MNKENNKRNFKLMLIKNYCSTESVPIRDDSTIVVKYFSTVEKANLYISKVIKEKIFNYYKLWYTVNNEVISSKILF